MNKKAEYNRCALPRLTAKLGEKDLEKWSAEDRLEHEKEATIEEKIRIRQKQKAKRRGEANRRMEAGQPAKKRRKIEQDRVQQGGGEKTHKKKVIKPATPPKKRRVAKEEGDSRPAKRIRKCYNIKQYISCKKWSLEEEKPAEEEVGAPDLGDEHGEDHLEEHGEDHQEGEPEGIPTPVEDHQPRAGEGGGIRDQHKLRRMLRRTTINHTMEDVKGRTNQR